jgi:SAM-dependent methyltransferase
MQPRDPEGAEPAAIAACVDLAGKRILEVGCGIGRLTSFAAARATHVYAFDPDAERVTQARTSLARELRAASGSPPTAPKRSTSRGGGSTSRCAGGRSDASRPRTS